MRLPPDDDRLPEWVDWVLAFMAAVMLLSRIAASATQAAEPPPDCNYVVGPCYDRGEWAPGQITNALWYTAVPDHIKGSAIYYAQGVIERTVKRIREV